MLLNYREYNAKNEFEQKSIFLSFRSISTFDIFDSLSRLRVFSRFAFEIFFQFISNFLNFRAEIWIHIFQKSVIFDKNKTENA